MSNSKRVAAYEKGLMAEDIAAQFLRGKGYDVLAERYKTRYGEIDLIMRDGEAIVAVEVKARRSMVEALEAVTFRNRRRVEKALMAYLAENCEYDPDVALRFDVVGIVSLIEIEHLENAWQADE
jgi:putative endonuclease